jgi:hypothetical protein
MNGLSDMLIGEPWMRRVRLESTGGDSPATETGDPRQDRPQDAARSEPPGWDPYDVWLHRIRQPRPPRGGAGS